MKKLNRIKLTQINSDELTEREMSKIMGGEGQCTCACSSPTGSNTGDNFTANDDHDYTSKCSCGCTGTSSTTDNHLANSNDGEYPDWATPTGTPGCHLWVTSFI